MSSEGGIYLCDGVKKRGEYFLTLQENTSINAHGSDLEEVKCDICDQITEWNGDGEAVLEVVFPEKEGKVGKTKLKYFSLSYNDFVDVETNEGLYEEGFCSKCRHSLGMRTSEPIHIKNKPKGAVCGVKLRYPNPEIFSKILIDAILSYTTLKADIKPVLYHGKDSGYVELDPIDVVKQVGLKGIEYLTSFHRSWRCTECGRETFTAYSKDHPPEAIFIAKHDVSTSPEVLFVDTGRGFSTLIRGDIRAALVKNKDIKRFCTDPVVLVDDDDIEYPELPEPDEFDWI